MRTEPPWLCVSAVRSPSHRKVGHVLFNPAAEHILASSSGDLNVKLWDISTGQAHMALKHAEIVQSLSWSANGSMLVTTSRDKKLRVWDVRQEKPVHEYPGHEGAKNSRAVWMGEHNRIATTGFSRMSERQIALWEPGRKDPIGGFTSLDSISGVCMPFWGKPAPCARGAVLGETAAYWANRRGFQLSLPRRQGVSRRLAARTRERGSLLTVCSDGNIRYFEYENDKFEYLSEYKSADPQRGVAFLPRRGINVHENEVMRAYKTVNDTYIEPISFTVPRRAETFQSDIYPPAIGLKPAMSAKEWFDGKTAIPPKIDLESVYEGNPPVEVPADYKPPAAAAAPAPAPKPTAAKKEPEPAPAPAPVPVRASATIADQKSSISAMANKFQDDKEDGENDAETSSFEEVSWPASRAALPVRSATKPQPVTTSVPAFQAKPASPVKPTQATPAPASSAAAPAAAASTAAVEASLDQIKQLLEQQGQVISAQSEKISAQTQIITRLATEVETLKKRVGAGTQDQSERIRQLELELEAARS